MPARRVLLVAVLVVLGSACSKAKPPAPVPSGGAAGCSTPNELASAGQEHIAPPATGTYNSDPPTSGSHYSQGVPNGPGFTGVQIVAIPNEVQVHNLEHGHVGIQYDPAKLDPTVKSALEVFTKQHAEWIFMAPRPTLSVSLAFTAWRRLSACSPTNVTEIRAYAAAFYEAFKDHAPERIPGTPVS